MRHWPKLTLACHNATHLLIDSVVSEGPGHDYRLMPPVLRGAVRRVRLDRVLADAGYDSERNHRIAREELGIRSTVIDLNRRGGRRWSKTKYRRQMYRRFPHRKYRQRAQVESSISRFKRRLGDAVSARSRTSQARQLRLRVLTYDLLLLAG
jgi:hypothetical protein